MRIFFLQFFCRKIAKYILQKKIERHDANPQNKIKRLPTPGKIKKQIEKGKERNTKDIRGNRMSPPYISGDILFYSIFTLQTLPNNLLPDIRKNERREHITFRTCPTSRKRISLK